MLDKRAPVLHIKPAPSNSETKHLMGLEPKLLMRGKLVLRGIGGRGALPQLCIIEGT